MNKIQKDIETAIRNIRSVYVLQHQLNKKYDALEALKRVRRNLKGGKKWH